MPHIFPSFRTLSLSALLSLALPFGAPSALALEQLEFSLTGVENDGLLNRLRASSLLQQARNDGTDDPQDLFSVSLADYQRLLETLYAQGYYSATIRIALDGREAALIPPLTPPNRIDRIAVSVAPGPLFHFAQTRIEPQAAGTQLPEGFKTGEPAKSGEVQDAVSTTINSWRDAGHAKAQVARQSLEADHNKRTLSADITVDPGAKLTFGTLIPSGSSAVKPLRIKEIAGLPEGKTFSPAELETVANRLRRTGAFQSVSVSEAAQPGPDNQLDIGVALVDALPRRFGAGVEYSTQSGLTLSGFWMHRNLLGGAERLRLGAEVAGIAGETGGIDYTISARFERPAAMSANTLGYATVDISSLNEPSYSADAFSTGVGINRIWGPGRTLDLGLKVSYAETDDVFGARSFALLELPITVEQDRRNDRLNPTKGHFARLSVTPFVGLSGEQSGAQLKFDGRVYKALGDRLVAAARLQLGSVAGPSLSGTAPNYLFYSGGGSTVRGQPHQSLGVAVAGGTAGGRSFVGLSSELRAKVSGAFSLVGFADVGYIGAESLYDGTGNWHAGAGLGLRYDTSVGPIRLDVAAPLSGSGGVQVYIGIGQAF